MTYSTQVSTILNSFIIAKEYRLELVRGRNSWTEYRRIPNMDLPCPHRYVPLLALMYDSSTEYCQPQKLT